MTDLVDIFASDFTSYSLIMYKVLLPYLTLSGDTPCLKSPYFTTIQYTLAHDLLLEHVDAPVLSAVNVS